MKTDIWMPLYIADYLADTTRLTTEQHGAYLLLIMDYWRNGPLPDDDGALANITRLPLAQWKKHRSALERMFQIEDGEWRHKRIDQEMFEAIENKANKSKAGKASAAKRWGNKQDNKNVTPVITDASQDDNPSPSPSPTPSISVVNDGGTHTDIHSEQGATACVSGISPTPAGAVCKRIIELGIDPTSCNPGHPTLDALLKAGAVLAEFEGAAKSAVAKGNKNFAYTLGIVKKQREDAASLKLHQGDMPGKGSKPWYLSSSGIEAKAKELGLQIERDEQIPQFLSRVKREAGVTEEMIRKARIDHGVAA